jgi:hypothetical protein
MVNYLIGKTHLPLMHSSGAQQSELCVQAPHVPPLHAWLLQSLHELHCPAGGAHVLSPTVATALS